MVTKPIIAAMLISGVAAASSLTAPLDDQAYKASAQPWTSVEHAERERRCRDHIEQVRAEAGRPKLDRGPADADKPLMMYAVDRKIDGCGVLVPVADPADIRQSPPPRKPERIPAR